MYVFDAIVVMHSDDLLTFEDHSRTAFASVRADTFSKSPSKDGEKE
jgi:hypothetical protein